MSIIVTKYPPKHTKKVTCYTCDAELEYTTDEIQNSGKSDAHIICPVCQGFIRFEYISNGGY